MLLAADIGGTKTICALFSAENRGLQIRDEAKFDSAGVSSLEELLEGYLKKNGLWRTAEITAACVSVAGPVSGGVCSLPNLGLTVEIDALKKRLSFIPKIGWCNDLVALGYGIACLPGEALFCLNRGAQERTAARPAFNKAVLAPGTGLGESVIIGEEVYPTEGGHSDFAPVCDGDIGLWRFLRRLYGHVSYERILSGSGLVNIYRFLTEQNEPHKDDAARPFPLSPEEISARALEKTCPLCVDVLDTFARILGAEAGNLALKSFALGGVYLGGGIPPKIAAKLRDGTFMQAFCEKGRFKEMLAETPVYLILDENAPLLGAAVLALKQS